jgi:hypothetical protein
VSLANGLLWGGVMGIVAMILYRDISLGLVMVLAMTLNLLLAALMGVLIPMTMLRLGRDPAIGSSVMITAVTDSADFSSSSDLRRCSSCATNGIARACSRRVAGIDRRGRLFAPARLPTRRGEFVDYNFTRYSVT